MICDGRGCSVIAHLNCYFSAGSQDADDTISDIEHWHCEQCGGLPRHMHPRPRAAKRARVSFDPLLSTPMATTSAQAVSTTHPSGGWGGHWPIRTAMPPTAKGKGKEAMEAPHSSERGVGATASAASRHRSIMRRDKESIDCDMPDRSNTELSTPLRHPVTTGDGSPLLTDAMLVDPDERNPLMPLSSGDCAMTIDSPLRRNRGPKGKKRLHQNPSGNGHKKPRGYTGRKPSGKHP
jgi:hypothetical protein